MAESRTTGSMAPLMRAAPAILILALVGLPRTGRAADTTSGSATLAVRMCLARQGYREAPLNRTRREVLTVRARVDSFDVRLLVDRRSPMTFVDRAALVELGYEPVPAGTEINFGGTKEPLYTVTPATFTIGGLTLDSTSLHVTRIEHFMRASGVDPQTSLAGIIGADFLRRCSAVLDIAGDRLFLKPPAPEPVVADTTADTATGLLESLGEKLRKREQERNRRQ